MWGGRARRQPFVKAAGAAMQKANTFEALFSRTGMPHQSARSHGRLDALRCVCNRAAPAHCPYGSGRQQPNGQVHKANPHQRRQARRCRSSSLAALEGTTSLSPPVRAHPLSHEHRLSHERSLSHPRTSAPASRRSHHPAGAARRCPGAAAQRPCPSRSRRPAVCVCGGCVFEGGGEGNWGGERG